MRILVILLISSFFTHSCSTYRVGSIFAVNNYRGQDYFSFFNYNVIKKGNVVVQARIAGTDYYGNVINIRANNGAQKKFSVLRMQNIEGSLIECFNELYKEGNFAKGGKGKCYERGQHLFDINIQPSKSYKSINFLRFFVE